MRYDFRKIQDAVDESGKTLRELEELTGVDYSTISRALKTGRSHQSTALALTKLFRIPMKDILIKRRSAA